MNVGSVIAKMADLDLVVKVGKFAGKYTEVVVSGGEGNKRSRGVGPSLEDAVALLVHEFVKANPKHPFTAWWAEQTPPAQG